MGGTGSDTFTVHSVRAGRLMGHNTLRPPSLMSMVLFLSGVQLMALGVVGEYVGRTYMEAKRRPAFVVRRVWRSGGGGDGPAEG